MSDLEKIEKLQQAYVAESKMLSKWRGDVRNPTVNDPLLGNEPLFPEFRNIWVRYLESLIESNDGVINHCKQLLSTVEAAEDNAAKEAEAKQGVAALKESFGEDQTGVVPVAQAASFANDDGTNPYFVSLDKQMSIENEAFDKVLAYLNS